MAVLMFWVGVASISIALGNLYGAPVGWIVFGVIVIPLSFVAILAEGKKP